MGRYERRRCEAVRVDGVRCGAWAVRGSMPGLCAVHAGLTPGAGAPAGNRNAVRHGFYARGLAAEEREALAELEGECGLRAELALARVMLGRLLLFSQGELTAGEAARVADAVFRGLGRVARLVVVLREEEGEAGPEGEGARKARELAEWDPRTGPPPDWDVYLDAVAAETGWDV